MNDQLREFHSSNQTPASQEIVPASQMPQSGGGLVNVRDLLPVALGGRSRDLLTNLDTSTEDGQALAINAMQSADRKASEVIGVELRVIAAVCGAADYDEGDGEVTTGPAVTLILEDRTTVFVSGTVAARAIGQLVQFARGKQWSPPKRLVISARKGKRPQPYHTVHVIVGGPGPGKGKAK